MKDYKRILQGVVNIINITKKSDIGFVNICAYIDEKCPELKGSEDEKIRLKLIEAVKGDMVVGGTKDKQLVIAWLEAQGEHANFRNKIQIGDKVTRNEDGVLVNLSQLKRVAKKDEKQGGQKPVEPQQDMLSQEKYAKAVDECIYGEQKPAWSEEDEERLSDAIFFVREYPIPTRNKRLLNAARETKDWLKSLKERYTWKPSDEQMHYLSWIANVKLGDSMVEQEVSKHLNELLEDLKKLK